MIDFTKIAITGQNVATGLLKNSALVFESQRTKNTARLKNMSITVHDSGRVEVAGSLHKFWNDGLHNWNDFGRLDLWDTIAKLCELLDINPQAARLHNIEFGVNLVVGFDVSTFLGGLLTYKNETFQRTAITGKGYYKQATKDRYLIKAYDKGRQYGRDDNILRFEVKVLKMEHLEAVGVRVLSDLMHHEKLTAFGVLLAEAWNDCLLVEPLPLAELTKPERRIYQLATDAKTWDVLTNRKQRSRLKLGYENLVNKYAKGGRKMEVWALLKTKWNELLAMPKNGDVLTDLQNANMSQINRSNIGLKRDIEPRRCLTTKVSIEHQKKSSKFVGEKTVSGSEFLVESLITKRQKRKRKQFWRTSEYYGSHNARNDFWNVKHNLLRRVKKAEAQTALFDPWAVIKLTDSQKEFLSR